METAKSVGVVQSVSLDWLTLTVKAGHGMQALMDAGKRAVIAEQVAGDKARDWYWKGYEGTQTRYVRWGERIDGAILVLASLAAQVYWRSVAAVIGKATRVDCAVDFTLKEGDNETFLRGVYEASDSWNSKDDEVTFYQNTKGGQTVYIGKRSRGRFLRVYNWTARHGATVAGAVVWRVELEIKGAVAEKFWERLKTTSDPDRLIESETRTHVLNTCLPLNLESARILMNATVAGRRVSAPGQTLAWLRASVRPAVLRLVQQGYLEDVENILGIPLVMLENK